MILKSFLTLPVTKRHVEQRIINTPPKHLFRIIQDVNQYSSFLPLCKHSEILRYMDDNNNNKNRFEAKLTVGMEPFFTETYVSNVTCCPDNLTVHTTSIQSQHFDKLSSQWKLTTPYHQHHNNSKEQQLRCHVDFYVELTVSDPLIVQILDQILEQVASRQVEAFAQRCVNVSPLLTED